MIAEHYDAVEALLPPGLTVYRGSVISKPTYPYVVLWGNQGTEDSETLGEFSMDLTLRVNVTAVGESFDSVLVTMGIVRTALNRGEPKVDGRSIAPLRQKYLTGVNADESVTIPGKGHPSYAVDQYTVHSTPA